MHENCITLESVWGVLDLVQTGNIPDKVIHPPLAARIEEGDDCPCFWIATFDAIATPFIAVATG